MNISVAIVSWAPMEALERCCRSLNVQTLLPTEVVIVDNRAILRADELREILSPDIKLSIIRAPLNLGCPCARNLAIANCTSEFVYSLDDDGWLDSAAIDNAAQVAAESATIAFVQSKIMTSIGETVSRFNSRRIFSFSGGSCLFRRSLILGTGGFPMHFFRQGEEYHLALRLAEAGFEGRYCAASVMYHEKDFSASVDHLRDSYGVAHSLRTVAELWPIWAVPLGLSLKLLSWAFYLIVRRGAWHAFARGLFLARQLRPFEGQRIKNRISVRTVLKVAAGTRKSLK